MRQINFLAGLVLFTCLVGCVYHPKEEVKSRVQVFSEVASARVAPRNIEVYYPPNFDSTAHYAVIIMHDGQNVFNDQTAYGGSAWRVDLVMDDLISRKIITPAIVVAVWNSKNRWSEYLPETCITSSLDSNRLMPYARPEIWDTGVFSDDYVDFLANDVLELLNREVLPKRQWQDVFVMGSSMGGLISAYTVCKYPAIFNGAACLSTHWPALDGACISYFQEAIVPLGNHKWYFDHGSIGLDSTYKPYQQRLDSCLYASGFSEKNFQSKYFPGDDHNEKSWRNRVATPLTFLLGIED
jgi:enterochelin esterase-like enzyme